MNKKISSFFFLKNGEFREIGALGSFKDSRIDIYLISEISFLSFFFHSGIYFPFSKLHSKGLHEFCASFFGGKIADCQKLRGEIKSTQSLLLDLYHDSDPPLLQILPGSS